MKKIKNGVLLNSIERLDSMASQKVQTKIALAITKSITKLLESQKDYEKTRKYLIESYAKQNPDGSFEFQDSIGDGGNKEYVFKSEEDKNECLIKVKELAEIEVDVDIKYITEEDIEKEENLTPMQVSALLLLAKE